jgi:phage repressor protein C with HTH and peptisase S24 domain
VTSSYLLEGEAAVAQAIKVLGSTADKEAWAPPTKNGKRDDVLMHVEGEPVGVLVSDDSMAPAYRRGDLLIGVRQAPSSSDNIIGVDCIVMTEDGQGLIKFLARGDARGRFNLRSYNPATGDLKNVRLSWIAPISWVKRRL